MKTIEEAAKYAYPYNDDEFTWETDEKRIAYEKGYRQSERWIPVEEELPTDDKRYLVKSKNGIAYLSYFDPIEKKWSSNCKVAFWLPIEHR